MDLTIFYPELSVTSSQGCDPHFAKKPCYTRLAMVHKTLTKEHFVQC